MLQYMQDGAMHTLDIDDYTIQTEWDGSANKLIWQMPAAHPQQLAIQERTQIYESSEGQTYVVSKRNPGRAIDFEAELVLTELDAGALINWSNGVTTLAATVGAILQGTGWTVDDQSARTDVQEIREFYGTLVEGITEVVSVWGNDLGVQYDNANKVVHLYSPGQRNPTGCYLTEDLNLFEAPQARGKAVRGEYYNRLYLIGADGLMLLEDSPEHDFKMVYFNSDGSGGMMCGNGGRCMVAFAADMGCSSFDFEAADGPHSAQILSASGHEKTVRLKMKDVSGIRMIDGNSYFLSSDFFRRKPKAFKTFFKFFLHIFKSLAVVLLIVDEHHMREHTDTS